MDEIRMQGGMLPVLQAADDIGGPYRKQEMEPPVGRERLLDWDSKLNEYKAGKARLERRVVASESWWKLRNETEEIAAGKIGGDKKFRSKSGWLHNVIVSKHADAMENYPEPIILPREPGDREQAKTLSDVLPVILEQNRFERTYSEAWWQKLKTGTAIYKVFWDQDKLNGRGDIGIQNVDLLHIFWEPGVTDIQDSPMLFHCELQNNVALEAQYPQLVGKLTRSTHTLTTFRYDDNVSTDEKSLVIDVYYKVKKPGGTVLHFCKYVNDVVLFSTENNDAEKQTQQPAVVQNTNPDAAQPIPAAPAPVEHYGLYDHGKYPFVFDALWPVEGSPAGYGYVDLCKNPQTEIDIFKTAFAENTQVGATPRYFQRVDGAVNEEEFLDLQKPIVHVNGSLDEDFLRVIDYKPLAATYIKMLDSTIQELRETSGNTETATGSTSGGVTAASAIAALQEASGKTSRDSTQASYRSFGEIVELCLELIRQFYELPRLFRITGEQGQMDFAMVSNAAMQPQPVIWGGEDLGVYVPVFDVKVKVQKRNAFSRTAQNELALQLYGQGFFNPQLTDQALVCLDMMDFEGKDEIVQKIMLNGTLLDKLMQTQQLVLQILSEYAPEKVEPMAAAMGMQTQQAQSPDMGGGALPGGMLGQESGVTAKARARAARTTEVSR